MKYKIVDPRSHVKYSYFSKYRFKKCQIKKNVKGLFSFKFIMFCEKTWTNVVVYGYSNILLLF